MAIFVFGWKYSLKFVPRGEIDDTSLLRFGTSNGLVQIMRKPLPEPMMTKFSDAVYRDQDIMS